MESTNWGAVKILDCQAREYNSSREDPAACWWPWSKLDIPSVGGGSPTSNNCILKTNCKISRCQNRSIRQSRLGVLLRSKALFAKANPHQTIQRKGGSSKTICTSLFFLALRNGKALQWGLYRIQLLNLIVQGKLLQWRIQLSNPLVGGKAHSPTNGHQPQSKSTTTLGYHRRWSAVVVLGVVVVVVVEIVVVVLGVILVLPGKLYHQELDCSHFVKDRIYFFSISSKVPHHQVYHWWL